MHSEQDLPKQTPIRTAPSAAAIAVRALSQQSEESNKPLSETVQSELTLADAQRLERMELLWLTMVQTYGHRWTSSFGESPTLEHAWARYLTGLTGKQIANGLARLDTVDNNGWPPSAPQFRQLCQQVPGLPTEAEAWEQALRGEYSHQAVKVAAEATGTFDLKSAKLNDKGLRERFNRNYAIVRARAVMGKPLDDSIPEGIEHQTKTPMQVQYAATHQQARDLITAQGLPTDPKAARALLLAKMGIKREPNHA